MPRGLVEASGTDTTLLKVEGQFNVTGPLETFANAGGVHLARAILAEFAENVAKLMAEQTLKPRRRPRPARRRRRDVCGAARCAGGLELKGGKILWRVLVSWLRQVFSGKREAQ